MLEGLRANERRFVDAPGFLAIKIISTSICIYVHAGITNSKASSLGYILHMLNTHAQYTMPICSKCVGIRLLRF